MRSPSGSATVGALLQAFFCERLRQQRNASPRTIACYRDAFRLLLTYVATTTGKSPSALVLADLDAPTILGFLEHLEVARHNTIRSRNIRLAAIRSFMHYVSLRDPESIPVAQRVLAIPSKRCDRPLVGFLTRSEIEALLDAPSRTTWSGRRDRVLWATLYNTGARVSEIVATRVGDIQLNGVPTLRILGKGRKERVVPLWKSTAALLREWLRGQAAAATTPVFPNRAGAPLTRSGVERRLRVAVAVATARCPALAGRRISPHTIRHTTAMHLLQAGVEITVIALWLGHESPSTTHLYIEADLAMKERALAKMTEPTHDPPRYRPKDSVLAFLDSL